jgi:hypothetical protein
MMEPCEPEIINEQLLMPQTALVTPDDKTADALRKRDATAGVSAGRALMPLAGSDHQIAARSAFDE